MLPSSTVFLSSVSSIAWCAVKKRLRIFTCIILHTADCFTNISCIHHKICSTCHCFILSDTSQMFHDTIFGFIKTFQINDGHWLTIHLVLFMTCKFAWCLHVWNNGLGIFTCSSVNLSQAPGFLHDLPCNPPFYRCLHFVYLKSYQKKVSPAFALANFSKLHLSILINGVVPCLFDCSLIYIWFIIFCVCVV